jgi:hypothetical protein
MVDKVSAPVVEQKTKLLDFVVNNDLSVSLDVSGWVWVIVLFIILIILAVKVFGSSKIQTLELDEAEIGVGNQKLKLKPNIVDSQIAYKIWVELSTRKIGIPVELDKDVIVEVYNSWYKFFEVTRELIKEIPASKLRRKETRNIIRLSIDVLNNGVRPHLTDWQARFRRWYEYELTDKEKINISPQDLQKNYPEYEQLTQDLLKVNRKLIKYREAMYKLAVGVC